MITIRLLYFYSIWRRALMGRLGCLAAFFSCSRRFVYDKWWLYAPHLALMSCARLDQITWQWSWLTPVSNARDGDSKEMKLCDLKSPFVCSREYVNMLTRTISSQGCTGDPFVTEISTGTKRVLSFNQSLSPLMLVFCASLPFFFIVSSPGSQSSSLCPRSPSMQVSHRVT